MPDLLRCMSFSNWHAPHMSAHGTVLPRRDVRIQAKSWGITGLCARAFSAPAMPLTDHRQFDILQTDSGWWGTECSSIN